MWDKDQAEASKEDPWHRDCMGGSTTHIHLHVWKYGILLTGGTLGSIDTWIQN